MRIVLACLAVLSLALPSLAKQKEYAPLPSQLLSAKTLFIENQAQAEIADRAYDELKKWNRFEIVTDRTKADLIFSFSAKQPERTSSNVSIYDDAGNWSHGRVSGGHFWIYLSDDPRCKDGRDPVHGFKVVGEARVGRAGRLGKRRDQEHD